ncbi:MAG: extracellular solute-binding protein [[Ruminococcus] torques]|uniref:extracellular solute-binding protein n=1 Tax=[Ruminococcus] torques TaxID=33039 RepID=UPI0039951CD0
MIKSTAKKIYLFLIFVLLYAPIITLMVLSFNNTKTRSKWNGFTGKWYLQLFQNKDIMNALYTTLIIAFLSALIATLIGTAAALGIQAMRTKARTLLLGVTNIPMLNADIVTGISLMLLFIACRFTLGFSTILLAHITFNIPYVILSVMPKLKQTSKRTYEAALDLGASPSYAFRKVVLPDIMPGIFSGFLLAFTMSLDDFVITHFTKGPGIDTLSTKIYSEVRKGIKPEMYALSTIMFLTVLILLFLVNMTPDDPKVKKAAVHAPAGKFRKFSRFFFHRFAPAAIMLVIVIGGFVYGSSSGNMSGEKVIVYNWGDYIDPEIITMFEDETGIDVVYEEYETNEIMYPKVQSGAIAYDVVCPSDYMVQRMIENDLLAEINYENVPNLKYIDDIYMEMSKQYDPENKYSVPYLWGTVGILYNKKMVDEPVDSWNILWDEKYTDSILMQDSVRDAFAVALKSLGYSLNSTDLDELEAAKKLLIKQKPLVQAYVIDQVRDKMIGNEAALGVIYSGEALYCQKENPDLEYVIPKEGSNLWIDALVIPKNAQNKKNAEAFINYLCRPDIAKMNFDYITYSIPNSVGRELIEDESMRESNIAFPDISQLKNCETFNFLGDENEIIYNQLWREIKSK